MRNAESGRPFLQAPNESLVEPLAGAETQIRRGCGKSVTEQGLTRLTPVAVFD